MSTHPSPSDPIAETQDAATPATATTWWLTACSLLLVGALVVASVVFFGRDGAESSSGAAEGEAEADLVGELVGHTRMAHEGLSPIVEDMEEFLPTDGSHPPLDTTDAATVNTWRTGVQEASAHFEDPPAGDSSHSVAHTGLTSSVRLLSMSVETYARAAQTEDEELRMDLLHIAMDLRTEAVVSWSAAATQLDLLSLGSGGEHVHLYLPAAPDSGALQPDGSGDGGGAPAPGEGHDDGH
ncbi:hypothetical protein Q8791_04555 [Nocardiopsis sp. CT-R113]|uniref:Uncharacterized protein n=1 Tax=Nocardiopsis codii TaxID=3065942 RepID=A0ABU7K2M1_9ACTN|nr:hypothetical protein [Nocardiopsis sp. CT-R113]MEE2036493.1 hypothetical protein [Nocardiopsis sp. CT-R113]